MESAEAQTAGVFDGRGALVWSERLDAAIGSWFVFDRVIDTRHRGSDEGAGRVASSMTPVVPRGTSAAGVSTASTARTVAV